METFLMILMLTALAGMIVFIVLAFVKGKGNRLKNFAKSGSCLFALVVIALILASIGEEAPVAQEVTAEASAEDKEAEEKVKQQEEEAKKAEEQAQKEQEEQEAKEQAKKEEERKAKEEEERKAKEEEERKAKEEQEAKEASVTVSQEQAVNMAQDYLNYTAFSKSGLIDQLEYEGFSTEDATYGVENITVDWQEQAVNMAQNYLDYTSFSRQGLIDQLTYEGFSTEHATYAVGQVGL
ncbi:Ltp family lipoprotein [Halobacillus seohaensis]|uniref:Ltp family lipoprotein n=1 Tax=Halobacillus seohaensis TaxID=447421 RepID=A0ABW2EQJ7_9BACI